MGKKFLIVWCLVGLAACHSERPALGRAESVDPRAGGSDLACDRLPKSYPANLEASTLEDRIEFRPRVTLHADGSSTTSSQPVRTRDFDRMVMVTAAALAEPVGSVEITNPRSCARIVVRAQKAISDVLAPARASEADQSGRLVLRLNDNPRIDHSFGALLVRPGPNILTVTYYGSNRATVLGRKQVAAHVEIESVISDQEQVVTDVP